MIGVSPALEGVLMADHAWGVAEARSGEEGEPNWHQPPAARQRRLRRNIHRSLPSSQSGAQIHRHHRR